VAAAVVKVVVFVVAPKRVMTNVTLARRGLAPPRLADQHHRRPFVSSGVMVDDFFAHRFRPAARFTLNRVRPIR